MMILVSQSLLIEVKLIDIYTGLPNEGKDLYVLALINSLINLRFAKRVY